MYNIVVSDALRPTLAINDENCVILNTHPGKSKIFQYGIFENQSGQKRGTCWYYTLSIIRPHYKNIEKIFVNQEYVDADVEKLLIARQREKVISVFRKQLTELNSQRELVKEFLDRYTIPINPLLAQQILNTNYTLPITIQNLLHDFSALMNQPTAIFADYYRQVNLTAKMSACSLAMQALGMDVNSALNNEIKYMYPNKTRAQLSLEESATLYFYAVKQAAVQSYKLQTSPWQPHFGLEGVKELMQCLKQYGVHVISGYIGRPYYKTVIRENSQLPNKNLYLLNNFDTEKKARGAHSIALIGAAIINGSGYVYFVDPKDASPATGEQTIYRLQYEQVLLNLTNIHGKPYLNDQGQVINSSDPFAICSNWQDMQEAFNLCNEKIAQFKSLTNT